VLATADHTAPRGDHLAAALLDADLAVLAAGPADYERYRRAVRAEYAHVTDEQWRTGRAAVLRALLAKDPLYGTPSAAREWTARAHHNLTGELASLDDRR
jgi:predicted metal-dependent HD superfamily phosphohydrolase